MKKFLALTLALVMVLSAFAGCGASETPETQAPATEAPETQAPATEAPAVSVTLEGTLEELLNKVIEKRSVEFMGGVFPIDLADTSEDGLWNLKRFTGLDNADQITEAAAFEPMMGSIPFSMVMVRVKEGVSKQTVAEAMKAGIDPRKWVCVEADEIQVVGFGDVVMFIMVGTADGMSTQRFVDAFQAVCAEQVEGAELEFTIK